MISNIAFPSLFPPSLPPSLSLSFSLYTPSHSLLSLPASLSSPLPPSPLSLSQFTHSATTRVKRVLSAISFIGVSILSSALTTFLATLPLLGAQILLFTRFAQILIVDTVVAILYTLIFCATFLSLFGPTGKATKTVYRLMNAAATIIGTIIVMIVLFVVATKLMSQYNLI